jgi:CheY-like chemotaxis protein
MSEEATILDVDDFRQTVRLLEAILSAGGFAVTSASSGPEAVDRIVSESVDLVLLDVQLHGTGPRCVY